MQYILNSSIACPISVDRFDTPRFFQATSAQGMDISTTVNDTERYRYRFEIETTLCRDLKKATEKLRIHKATNDVWLKLETQNTEMMRLMQVDLQTAHSWPEFSV